MYAVIGDNSAPYYFRLGNSLGVPAGRLEVNTDDDSNEFSDRVCVYGVPSNLGDF
jgi:hypothetical protein